MVSKPQLNSSIRIIKKSNDLACLLHPTAVAAAVLRLIQPQSTPRCDRRSSYLDKHKKRY
jgi:hypothetical protein